MIICTVEKVEKLKVNDKPASKADKGKQKNKVEENQEKTSKNKTNVETRGNKKVTINENVEVNDFIEEPDTEEIVQDVKNQKTNKAQGKVKKMKKKIFFLSPLSLERSREAISLPLWFAFFWGNCCRGEIFLGY